MSWPNSQRFIVVVGASGAGKDSVLRAWRERATNGVQLHFVERLITREADPAGEAHRPTTREEMIEMQLRGQLAWHWSAHGMRYGVLRESMAPLEVGGYVVLNGSRAHLPAMRRQAPLLRVVEISAPASVRAARLAARSRESEAARLDRLRRNVHGFEPDLRLVNVGALTEVVDALHGWWRQLEPG